MSCLESPVTKKMYGSTSLTTNISNLPDVLLESILTRMPLRDAVRTSVLSKRWRYSWAKLQKLVFDDTLCGGQLVDQSKILIIIYQVLSRIQTVHKFCLSSVPVRSCPEIDNLIIGLASAQIEEFTLHIFLGNPHKLPLSLFSYPKLSHLDLLNCEFSPPSTFRGFSKLVSLELVEVCITEESFVRLISSCPLLENLKFQTYRVTTYGPIEIDCASLKILRFIGTFKSISFKNASNLATVSLRSKNIPVQLELFEGGFFYRSLPALENLEIDGHYIRSLSAHVDRFKDNLKFVIPRHLKNLQLDGVCLGTGQERIFVYLLMLSPNLQFLKIKVNSLLQDFQGLSYVPVWPRYWFKQLQDVRVDSVCGTRNEIEFLKNILAKSPVLEKMIITTHRIVADKGFAILKELNICERMSPKVKIFI